MILGVISDTHGVLSAAEAALPLLRKAGVTELIHCGDVGSVEMMETFAEWPTHYVEGNVDYDPVLLDHAARHHGGQFNGEMGSVELEGVRIAFLHGHHGGQFDEELHSGNWDLLCCGHTHVAKLEKIGETTLLNPGALYRASPRTLAIVELPELKITHHPVPQG